jgi:hypothetical protein
VAEYYVVCFQVVYLGRIVRGRGEDNLSTYRKERSFDSDRDCVAGKFGDDVGSIYSRVYALTQP